MAKKHSGLGRGLDAIFLDNSIDTERGDGSTITKIKLSLVDPNKNQPRKSFEKEALSELATSIRENGVLQPILVREYDGGRYQIIAGERRFRASKLAELEEIPAIILDIDNKKTAEISLIENIQREDLSPIEEAFALKALAEEYSMTQEQLSEKIGKSRSAIANSVRLLDLPTDVLELVAAKKISGAHGRTLLGLKDRSAMKVLADRVVELDLSVRQLEEEVRRANKPIKPQLNDDDEPLPIVDYFRELEVKMERELGRRVKIEEKGRKKSVTLFYQDNEDLDELLERIFGKDFAGGL